MLRVGLTGGLGSGKSAAAAMFGGLGAHVISADELGRALMQPGEPVFAAIVRQFGQEVVTAGGELDRARLAQMAFAGGRVRELSAIVHPAVIARQTALAKALEQREPAAVLLVESALLFETPHAGPEGWRRRFDRVVLVIAEEQTRVERFLARGTEAGSSAADREIRVADARSRMAQQLPDREKRRLADFLLQNDGTREQLQAQVEALWPQLVEEARSRHSAGGKG